MVPSTSVTIAPQPFESLAGSITLPREARSRPGPSGPLRAFASGDGLSVGRSPPRPIREPQKTRRACGVLGDVPSEHSSVGAYNFGHPPGQSPSGLKKELPLGTDGWSWGYPAGRPRNSDGDRRIRSSSRESTFFETGTP